MGLALGAAISNSFTLLKKAELELKEVVAQNLATAVQMRDKHALESYSLIVFFRFVKICPQLNMHKEGLDRLAEYLNTMV